MFVEYKVVAPPRRAMRFKDLAKGEDAFHRTLAETLTALGMEGWSYVGVERLPQTRRSWLFWSRADTVEVMIFSRAVRPILRTAEEARPAEATPEPGPAITPVETVRARRVTRTLQPHEIRRPVVRDGIVAAE
jgi:hypothetical protein